ncbi:MAG TPA: CHAD domain-containing protein, partial [Caulobacteraceae bacterium]
MDGSLDAPRAQVASRPGPGKPMSARQALQLIARACVQQIQAYEPRLMRSRSPEALHQIRVALRRWRAALSLFGPDAGG